jgi:carotenoid cleavage dioxygenase
MDKISDFEGRRMGRANTNLVSHAGRILALEEQDVPYEVVGSWDPQSQLRTVGKVSFQGQLKSPFTAHPKVSFY